MSKAINIGTLTANGQLSFDASGYFASKWTVYLSDNIGGGTVTFRAGDISGIADIMVTNPANASLHSALTATDLGVYTFNAVCEQLRFVLAGSTSPNLVIFLFPEKRPNKWLA